MLNNIAKYILMLFVFIQINAQDKNAHSYWQSTNKLTAFRLPLPISSEENIYIDLDNDGDPDVLRYTILDNIPVQWIDDDDDMQEGDIEGDMDSDCLMIDRNRDGKYGAEYDLILDWNDEDSDQVADLQVLVDHSGLDDRGLWKAHYMWFIDTDNDLLFNYVDWHTLIMEGWDHSGRAKFFTDYQGKSVFLKIHANTFNINDLRYNWENPFLFYDPDNDGQTEMAVRYVDLPKVVIGSKPIEANQKMEDIQPSVLLEKKIKSVRIGIDMDNDSEAENEFDYDMSIEFTGKGFDYSDQVHKYKSLRGLPEADKYFFDPRWRQLTELIYADHDNGYKLPFERDNWQDVRFVFDEDDDCHRWERVEFYDDKDLFKSGARNGGLDNNPQADVSGDRGEWDTDFSGNGQLYIGKFDGRIHLYGAEWGAWRIDQNAKYYQGWQGWRGKNIQPEDLVDKEPETFATIKYSDTDENGFVDLIEYDLDGDSEMESKVSLIELGISDSSQTIDISNFEYKDFRQLYKSVSYQLWEKANKFINLAESHNLNYIWYAPLLNPKSEREKYHNGYWLSFYLYKDLKHYAELIHDKELSKKLDVYYYSNEFDEKAYAKFVPERMDDFAWENDRIAYRMYGPALEAKGEISNGIDVWVKSTSDLILDKWYAGEDYHTDHGEGLDYYKVGPSLGAGGSALLENGKLNKSKNYIDWNIITNGPDRTVFELKYAPRKYKDATIEEIKKISLEAGSNLNKVEVKYTSDREDVVFKNVIGVTKHTGEEKGETYFDAKNGIFAYWEPTNKIHGNTAIGVLVKPNMIEKLTETDEHFLLELRESDSNSYTYYTGAGWSKSGQFKNLSEWKIYLKNKKMEQLWK